MSMILSYAANGFGIFVVGGIALFTALAHSPLTPFFWHPITMSLAFVFYMVQGVLALVSKHSVLHSFFEFAERKFKIDAHYWCQLAATALYTLGFISIIYNKFAKGSNHFTTWHSWFGLLTGLVCYSQLLLGLYLYYTWPKMALAKVWLNRPKDLTVKRWHRTLAILGFFCGVTTCLISLWSSFVVKNFPFEVSLLIGVSLVIVAISTALIGLRVELPEWLQ